MIKYNKNIIRFKIDDFLIQSHEVPITKSLTIKTFTVKTQHKSSTVNQYD